MNVNFAARLVRQHAKDTWKAIRYRYLRPAIWETRAWIRLVDESKKRSGEA